MNIKVKDILILKYALEDLEAGQVFYESKEQGIGDYFYDSIISDFESLYLYAGLHGIEEEFYKMYSKRFPYAIYYTFEDGIVKIAAVLPMKRDPVWIKERLTGPNK
jgi:hypothetical protein